MFAGYGGASFALKKANIPFEIVGYSEIDKFAIQCYEQNHSAISYVPLCDVEKSDDKLFAECHNESFKPDNFGDCMQLDPNDLPDFDLLTGGFPCQAFSVAGKSLGELDTRGTLFHDIVRVVKVKKPKFIVLENVKGLVGKKHRATFDKILRSIIDLGYYVDWKVLNSKNYGTPQNRERVWIVFTRYDLGGPYLWKWPKEQELKLFLKDVLDDEVEAKYYLSKDQINKLLNYNFDSGKRICDVNGVCSSLNTMQRGHRQPKILSQPLKFLNRNQKNLQGDYSGCVDSCNTNGVRIEKQIRKLTPKECFRLMGFFNDEINLNGLSDTQKYKLAGNGWDINLVSQLFEANKELLKGE